jgi:hypothetical protein
MMDYNLVTGDDPPGLTNVGLEFQTIAMNDPVTVNLLSRTVEDIVRGANSDNSADVKLKVPIHNNGNHRLGTDFEVTFFSNEELTKEIGTANIEAPLEDWSGLQGCAVHHVDAFVVWSELPLGIHQYWAKIDPLDQIGEDNESDNIATGMVQVVPARGYLPVVTSN